MVVFYLTLFFRPCWSSGMQEDWNSLTTPEFWSLPKMLSCKYSSMITVQFTLDLWLIAVVCFSYRVCEMLYERKRQFSKVLSCYFRDSHREVGTDDLRRINLTDCRTFLKGTQWMYFELFWSRTKLPLNGRKPENNSLLRWKNTKEITINHKGTKIVKDGEGSNGLQTTNSKNSRCTDRDLTPLMLLVLRIW